MPYFSGVQNQDGPPVAKGYKRFSAGDAGAFTIPLGASRNEPLATNFTVLLIGGVSSSQKNITAYQVAYGVASVIPDPVNLTIPSTPRKVVLSITGGPAVEVSGTITSNTLNPGEYIDVYVVAF